MALTPHFLSALECAKGFIERREHSMFEMRRKLHCRGYEDVVDDVLSSLTAAGLIDDERYARSWVTARIGRKAEGRHRLVSELIKRGVAGSMASVIVAEELPAETEQAVLHASMKTLSEQGYSWPIIVRRLLAKGFSSPAVHRSVAVLSESNESLMDS